MPATELEFNSVESGVALAPEKIARRGYGTELIQEALAQALKATVDYALSLVTCAPGSRCQSPERREAHPLRVREGAKSDGRPSETKCPLSGLDLMSAHGAKRPAMVSSGSLRVSRPPSNHTHLSPLQSS